MSVKRKKGVAPYLVLVGLVFMALVWLFPMYIAFINSFKPEQEFVQNGVLALPQDWDFSKFSKFWGEVNFSKKLLNSAQVSLFVALIGVVLSFLTAYAIGIGRVKGRIWILGFFMVAFTIPQEALIYPLYSVSKMLNLYDNIWSIIIIFGVMSTGFGTYLLSSVMSTFPDELLEAARVDGASPWRILRSIVLPLLRPTLFVLATMFFIFTWNEFLIPLVMLPSNDNQTVTLAMAVTTGQYTSDPTARAAAACSSPCPRSRCPRAHRRSAAHRAPAASRWCAGTRQCLRPH